MYGKVVVDERSDNPFQQAFFLIYGGDPNIKFDRRPAYDI